VSAPLPGLLSSARSHPSLHWPAQCGLPDPRNRLGPSRFWRDTCRCLGGTAWLRDGSNVRRLEASVRLVVSDNPMLPRDKPAASRFLVEVFGAEGIELR
jgi:hypothetical protein